MKSFHKPFYQGIHCGLSNFVELLEQLPIMHVESDEEFNDLCTNIVMRSKGEDNGVQLEEYLQNNQVSIYNLFWFVFAAPSLTKPNII